MTTWDAITIFSSTVLCVVSALSSWFAWRAAKLTRSARLLADEIREIDDCMRKLLKAYQRIEGRQTAMQRRESSDASTASHETRLPPLPDDKAALRRMIGLIPGRAAPHGANSGNDPA